MASYSPIPRPGSRGETKELEIHKNHVTAHDSEVSQASIPQRTRTLRERLGDWEIMLLVTSSIGIVIALAFLAILWEYGLSPTPTKKFAHSIVQKDWTVKATTIASMVIRLGVAVQAGVCTSLAAALLLEGNGVPLPDVLHFAALRSVSTAPPTILFPITRRFRLYARSAPAILIAIVFLTATACQLASTILVSDIKTGSIEGPNQELPGALGTSDNGTNIQYAKNDKIDYWGSRPFVYPSFGEFWEPGHAEEHAHDTGAIYRGMIPFDNARDRTLRRFEGLTDVFASRIGCVAPKIEAQVQYNPEFTIRYLVGNATYLPGTGNGLLSCKESNISNSATGASIDRQETCAISFNCTIPYPNGWLASDFSGTSNGTDTESSTTNIPVDEWRLGVCAIHKGSRWHFEKSLSSQPLIDYDDVGGVRTDVTMVLNHTDHTLRSSPSNGTTFDQAAHTSGEWATYDLQGDGMVDLSLCFTELNTEARHVRMESDSNTFDAQINWNSTRRNYNTWEIQNRFNSTGGEANNVARGVMAMKFLQMNESETPTQYNLPDFSDLISPGLYKFREPGKVGTYMPMCLFCDGDDTMSIKVHPVTTTLFYDIIILTRHPALGLQSIFHSIVQSAYYEELPSYDVSLPIRIHRSQIVQKPFLMIGFSIVIAMLGIHFIMVGTMVCLFAKRTKQSMIGEIWHSIGQVMNDVPQTLLNEHVGRTEDEIRVACRTTGLDDRIVGLKHSPSVQRARV